MPQDLASKVAWESDRGRIYRARAEDVYPLLPDHACSLLISDGPYNMGKAEWDKFESRSAMASWYEKHIRQWERVCAKSATVYAWNTADGWAAIDPIMRQHGWEFVSLITWYKLGGAAMKSAYDGGSRCWPDVTEVCGMYRREEWSFHLSPSRQVGHAAGADDRNWIRVWLGKEWDAAGLLRREADAALGTSGMAGHYFGRSQWELPTWSAFQTLHEYANRHGAPRERPYLIHESAWEDGAEPAEALRETHSHLGETFEALQETYSDLRRTHEKLRREYEEGRPEFRCSPGFSNVWATSPVSGLERLKASDGTALHPCQKPVSFSERMIKASSRPGEMVLEPFGGTCRAAAAIEMMAPSDIRSYVCAEPDQDEQRYLPAVVEDLAERVDRARIFRLADNVGTTQLSIADSGRCEPLAQSIESTRGPAA